MATFHFKTRGGLILFIILCIVIPLSIPVINTAGVPAFILLVLVGTFVLYVISAAFSGRGITPKQEYEMAVEKSNGVEKLRLKARHHFIENLNKKDGVNLSFPAAYSVTTTHMVLTDTFYGVLRNNFESSEHGELFDEMSNAVASDKEKELTVASRLFGIAFGIVLEKAADSTGAKINKKMIKSFLDVYMPDNVYKKEFSKAMTFYLDLKTSDTRTTWTVLEKMTYLLMDAKIERDKDDIADPIVIMPLKTAIAYTRNSLTIGDHEITELKDREFIK